MPNKILQDLLLISRPNSVFSFTFALTYNHSK